MMIKVLEPIWSELVICNSENFTLIDLNTLERILLSEPYVRNDWVDKEYNTLEPETRSGLNH